MRSVHIERHRADRVGWLRAAVLGANDGVVSVASLVVGVAAGGADPATVLLAGMAGLAAGAMSMAAGEYVSVKSQADTEHADLERERRELIEDPAHELDELTEIYVSRGLDEPLARQVAVRLTSVDALGAHARDELGITETLRARPAQAALASALAFALGALLPLLAAVLAPTSRAGIAIVVVTLAALLLLGATAAWAGGAAPLRGALRVTFWGAIAMALTAGVGRLFDLVG
ncbi:MAG: VIT1/CCC1 transporter family protein [Gammaproteobacteria bacterium]|nr:MAG: VIT1/CCC1 transporter family protein [Gammaproteobacteria bacterium]